MKQLLFFLLTFSSLMFSQSIDLGNIELIKKKELWWRYKKRSEYEMKLFSSLQLREKKLKNRIFVSPMCQYSSEDGMPNDWELANGTNPLVNDANEDPDFDRMANWQEYLAGTSPTDGASVLKIESALLTGTKIALSFSAISNHNYSVQTRLILGGVWQKWQDVAAAPSNRTVRLTNDALAATNHLYRLVTPVQP